MGEMPDLCLSDLIAIGSVPGDYAKGRVASCIRSLVCRWRFPAPSKGSVDVVFPFVFQSSKQ
jgi:hypothetical protein